ncbi:hypothetical protein B0G75_11179 [Paraburkholderia sp. BL18I3N2]|nr:hypothetical protein B0G75_11179 [Paraburkholderia sp. BL18I3N2]
MFATPLLRRHSQVPFKLRGQRLTVPGSAARRRSRRSYQ